MRTGPIRSCDLGMAIRRSLLRAWSGGKPSNPRFGAPGGARVRRGRGLARRDARKRPGVKDWLWPTAGVRSVDFIATLMTASLHLQRLLWSREIKRSHDSCQSFSDMLMSRVDPRSRRLDKRTLALGFPLARSRRPRAAAGGASVVPSRMSRTQSTRQAQAHKAASARGPAAPSPTVGCRT